MDGANSRSLVVALAGPFVLYGAMGWHSCCGCCNDAGWPGVLDIVRAAATKLSFRPESNGWSKGRLVWPFALGSASFSFFDFVSNGVTAIRRQHE